VRSSARFRWRFLGAAVLATGGFFVYKALRGLPLKQILLLIAKMKDRVPEQIESALNNGEGSRLILVRLMCGALTGTRLVLVHVVPGAAR
jgi:hypothetical protein